MAASGSAEVISCGQSVMLKLSDIFDPIAVVLSDKFEFELRGTSLYVESAAGMVNFLSTVYLLAVIPGNLP